MSLSSSLSMPEMHSFAVAALSWQGMQRHTMVLSLDKLSLTRAGILATLFQVILCLLLQARAEIHA